MRRSSAFWRTRPAAKAFGSDCAAEEEEERMAEREVGLLVWRRWDSAMRRRSSRSCARREGASSGRAEDDDFEEGWGVGFDEEVEVGSGGREDCEFFSSCQRFVVVLGEA